MSFRYDEREGTIYSVVEFPIKLEDAVDIEFVKFITYFRDKKDYKASDSIRDIAIKKGLHVEISKNGEVHVR